MQGSDFHVPGKNFGAQPGGQVGGGGSSIGIQSGRGISLGVLPIRQSTSIFSGLCTTNQTVLNPNIQSQSIQGTQASTTTALHSSSQEMGKQTHLQTPPPNMSQVYSQNQTRSVPQQNYYPTSRSQQTRNINHRSAQTGTQSQVVSMPGVGATNGQHTAIYPHSGIPIQSSTMYVPNQVSGLPANPHQQNVYSMSNQMPIQFSGPPQRHQSHQNQYQYQSYQTHAALFAPSGVFGYAHGTQHPGYFYHQTPNAPINLNRGASAIGGNNQHVSNALNNTQGAAIVSQTTLQQQQQQSQAIHTLGLPIPQTDVYPGFTGGNTTTNTSTKSKKQIGSNAIYDIVNPATGRNISAEIYTDRITSQSGHSGSKESSQTLNSNAELVADFAARVAKLASESPEITTVAESDNRINSKVNILDSIDVDDTKHNILNSTDIEENVSKEEILDKPSTIDSGIQSIDTSQFTSSDKTTPESTTPLNQNIINKSDSLSQLEKKNQSSENKCKNSLNSQTQEALGDKYTANQKVQHHIGNIELDFLEKKSLEKLPEPQSSREHTTASKNQLTLEDIQHKSDDIPNKTLEIDTCLNDQSNKSADGRAMQKQKNKNKVKTKESNRKGVEKETNDMEMPTNVIKDNSSGKHESKENVLSKEIDKEDEKYSKDVEETYKYEIKVEHGIAEIHNQSVKKNISSSTDTTEKTPVTETVVPQQNKNSNSTCGESITTEISSKDVNVYTTKIDKEQIPPIVAQKNEENTKVSGLCDVSKDSESSVSAVNSILSTMKITQMASSLKYTYSDDQWSPINTTGKKVYDREFLMKLQHDPNSKIKPTNLPDLDVVLKDVTKTRSPVDFKFKEPNLNRHDSLFPGFAKSSLNTKVLPPTKKSHSGKLKTSKPNVIHVSLSLREDVKLRETENAWKPARLMQNSTSEDDSKTEALYKRVRSVLNKLTPQKFDTLVKQVRELPIDTQERLQGVIDLVFEKAVDEPNFSVAYALMCKELSNMHVVNGDSKDSSSVDFRKLILTRCQTEFEKNTVDENARREKLQEIEACTDPEKKKELQMNLEDEERRMRVKSVGNIRFIGELFKQNMISSKIMLECINHLLSQQDEENLECLCKLLTTIGKVLESKNTNLSEYFKQMQQIANRKGKISSRIRFMLQDVLDLKANKWMPRRDDSNPKTMDQIQREAESERLDINNSAISTPRKDERINERKRNRAGTGSVEDGWSHPVGRPRQVYSVETAKLKNKPPSVDDMQLGSRSNYQWSKNIPNSNPKMTTPNKFSYLENVTPEVEKKVPMNISGSRSTASNFSRVDYKSNYDRNSRNGNYQLSSSSYNRDNAMVDSLRSQNLSSTSSPRLQTAVTTNPQLSIEELQPILNSFYEEYIAGEEDIEEAVKFFKATFPDSSHSFFVHEIINAVLEKSEHIRNKTSQLLEQLLSHKCLSSQDFKTGFGNIIKEAVDLIIDIPKLWKYFAKILVHPFVSNIFPLSEMKDILQQLSPKLRSDGQAVEFMSELLLEINTLKGPEFTIEMWGQSGLQWTEFINDLTKVDQIIREHKLEFLVKSYPVLEKKTTSELNVDKIHEELLLLLKDYKFDDICNWIQVNLCHTTKEPVFIRMLMTTILESSVEQCNGKWTFKIENFDKLQKLIQRYVDADDYLELQCLYAVQTYITKLGHPKGLIVKIMTHLWEDNILSNEAFLAWEKSEEPLEREGKSEALSSLKPFFTLLKEGEDISSSEEA